MGDKKKKKIDNASCMEWVEESCKVEGVEAKCFPPWYEFVTKRKRTSKRTRQIFSLHGSEPVCSQAESLISRSMALFRRRMYGCCLAQISKAPGKRSGNTRVPAQKPPLSNPQTNTLLPFQLISCFTANNWKPGKLVSFFFLQVWLYSTSPMPNCRNPSKSPNPLTFQ